MAPIYFVIIVNVYAIKYKAKEDGYDTSEVVIETPGSNHNEVIETPGSNINDVVIETPGSN
ncbi:12490_t:CDS:2, partial [Gigaspora rosea]